MSPKAVILLGTLLYVIGWVQGDTPETVAVVAACGVIVGWAVFLVDWLATSEQRVLGDLVDALGGREPVRPTRVVRFLCGALLWVAVAVFVLIFWELHRVDNQQQTWPMVLRAFGGLLCSMGAALSILLVRADEAFAGAMAGIGRTIRQQVADEKDGQTPSPKN